MLTSEQFELLKDIGYTPKVIEYFTKKVNVGTMPNPSVEFSYTGPCGDTVKLYLRITNEDIIEDAKFHYLGCPALASAGSAMTQTVRDKTLSEAKRVNEQDILSELGGLPEEKLHCATLVITTLWRTIEEYEKSTGKPA